MVTRAEAWGILLESPEHTEARLSAKIDVRVRMAYAEMREAQRAHAGIFTVDDGWTRKPSWE